MDPSASEPAAARLELVRLLGQVGSGDRAALRSVYDRTSAKLFGICLRVTGSEDDAADVLQDVYLTVWRKADRFDAGRASPITWLALIARSRAIDLIRRRKATAEPIESALDIPDENPDALTLASASEDRGRLEHCLGELDERGRQMIRAAFLDGFSYPQLAEREGVPLPTMKSWIRRSLQRLKGCLDA
ncbi:MULTISPECIES: sigma-70 family RNA polymerase sigma factor [Sphingomonas]|uniref:sigma-70 family RNA polymerase sigma factor n=1 Tax=Sphingomonas TaxID=13687 RepID=UPI000DEF7A68|nr:MULTISPECIES: sigma-70 family RNA polymerase sigma factor [Sphingomonas]